MSPGEFEVSVSGSASDELRGAASFTTSDDLLSLRLDAGSGSGFIPMPGLLLSVPWDGAPGTLTLDGSANLTRSFVVVGSAVPSMFEVEAGTITVETVTESRIGGSFDVEAASVNTLAEDGKVRARGSFIALSE